MVPDLDKMKYDYQIKKNKYDCELDKTQEFINWDKSWSYVLIFLKNKVSEIFLNTRKKDFSIQNICENNSLFIDAEKL